MHTWPGRKIKARKHTAAATATENTGVRCGKWVLRSTKSRICRGQHFTPSTPARVAPKQKRKLASSPTSSQNSCTLSILSPMEEDYDDLKKWPKNHTKEFILAMLEEQKRRLGPNSVKKVPFQESNWNRIVDDVARRTGTRRYTKRRLKGKNKRMKHLFNKFIDLMRKTGLEWDEELGTVTAPDEVWEGIIAGAQNNAIVVVLTSADVSVKRFCLDSCGTHGSENNRLVYIWVGNSQTPCPGLCARPLEQPNSGPHMEMESNGPPNGL
ncbi:hypothetical protein Vadar_005892 [Vaccinium darrowii]|uniref:Uncharacterized protein n=1 Tax=Vaccinium darrowii TaxID=229202 RepID=A0ACB7XX58_9ERIC|nr:hypothetical protein Vadar_005892 [Vaccinium darrowii]